jgi:nucleotide-binding universal stress UspA family protein
MLIDPRADTRHTHDCGHIAVNDTPGDRVFGTTLLSTRLEPYSYPDKVLVAFGGSPLSERALTYALENFPNATMTAIYVIGPIDSGIDVEAGGLPVAEDWYDNAQERATRVHTTATDLAAEHGIDLDTVTEVGGPARTILEYVDDHGIDQIVPGTADGQESTGRYSEALPRQSAAGHGFR